MRTPLQEKRAAVDRAKPSQLRLFGRVNTVREFGTHLLGTAASEFTLP